MNATPVFCCFSQCKELENLRVRNTLTEEFCLRAGFKRIIHRMLLHVQETRLRRLLIRPPQLAVCLEIRVSGPCVAFPGQLLSLCFWLPAATNAGESFSPQQMHLLKWCSQTTELKFELILLLSNPEHPTFSCGSNIIKDIAMGQSLSRPFLEEASAATDATIHTIRQRVDRTTKLWEQLCALRLQQEEACIGQEGESIITQQPFSPGP